MPDGDGVPVNVRLWAEKHIAALTPPAAAPRVETCGFCGKGGKHAAGESCPELDGDGAPWKLIPAPAQEKDDA